MKTILKQVTVSTLLAASVATYGAYAQDSIGAEADQILNSEQIDIDGSFHRKSEADKQADQRRNLEKENENLVRKKIEDIRMEEERRMTERLKDAFNNGLGKMNNEQTSQDSVAVVQASTQKVEAPLPVENKDSFSQLGKIKVIPNVGVLNIQGDGIDFESKVSGGVNIESMVSNRFSFGVGINYSTLTATDLDSVNNNGLYNGNIGYNNWYSNTYDQGREMNYKHLLLELNSKFFLVAESRVRPYVGLGIGYNRTNLKYTDKGQMNTYQYNGSGVQYGNEAYTSNYVSGSALLGSEISFSQMIGMNLELSYSRGLTGGFGAKNEADMNVNDDQRKLDNVGTAIEDSSFIAVKAGILIAF